MYGNHTNFSKKYKFDYFIIKYITKPTSIRVVQLIVIVFMKKIKYILIAYSTISYNKFFLNNISLIKA